jgi:flagellar basal-body rod modification protein FlgD
MGSLWNNAAAQSGGSPFAGQAGAPTPGSGAAARFQSILQAAGRQGKAAQPGLSPTAAQASASGASSAASGTSSSTQDADATISANDFLTLLVTEMQNQDPTADVDPNAYIDQLVQINSLEQLISINQNLAAVLGAASSTTPGSSTSAAGDAASPSGAGTASNPVAAAGRIGPGGRSSPSAEIGAARYASRSPVVRGNLSAPGTAPAAKAVARSLDGQARGAGKGHAIRDIPTRALP